MTKLTKDEVLKIYDRVFHYHFQQPHQINNILTVESEIQDAYQAKNIQINALKSALLEAKESVDFYLAANDPSEFGCACDPSVGHLCGPCYADKQQYPLRKAIAIINEVLNATAKT